MPRMIEKFVALIQWLSAPEELPSKLPGGDPQGAGIGQPGFSRWLLHGDTLQQASLTLERAPKPQGLLRCIFSTETLLSPEPGLTAKPSHPPRFWRWILAGEELPVAQAADRDQASRTMLFRRLLETERCPRHAGGAIERREVFFRRLLAPEQCPSQPAPVPAAKRGFARWLLKREDCPVEPTSPSVRHHGFWRNLFAPEKL